MIEIIPSLAVYQSKCVRLKQGNYEEMDIYAESPVEMARKFEDHGIRRVHMIDLEGAKEGRVINFDALEVVAGHTNLEIDFGGGINTDGDINKCFEYGASMVTVGSLAYLNKDLFNSWLISYGRNKIQLSADAENGIVKIRGWQKSADTSLLDLLEYYFERSVLYVKCSDVSLDGIMQGPSFSMYKEILEKFSGIRLTASGGVSSMDDIKQLDEMGLWGALIGRAVYEEKISLKEIAAYLQ